MKMRNGTRVMNKELSIYFDATNYARKILGDDAVLHFPLLRKLARRMSLAELASHIRGLRPPELTGEVEPEHKHFSGDIECPTCKLENRKASVVLAGVNAKAQAMFESHEQKGYREFVAA